MSSRKNLWRRRPLQHLDTSHGLRSDGPHLSPSITRSRVAPVRSVDLSADALGAGNHEAGSGRPSPPEVTSHAELQPTTPILRRRRSARQNPLRPHPRSRRPDPASRRTCPPRPPPSSTPSRPSATASSSAASACSPGTGSPTSANANDIPFVLGHALAMKAIHGGKAKNDQIDAAKLAGLLRGGYFPLAYVYPKDKRETRDLLRRRSFFVRQRAQLIAHIQITNSQYNLPPFDKKLTYAGNRTAAIAERFAASEHATQRSHPTSTSSTHYDTQIAALELHLTRSRQGRRSRHLRLPAHDPRHRSDPRPDRCSTRSTGSRRFPEARTSSRTRGWCAAPTRAPARSRASAAARSATPT